MSIQLTVNLVLIAVLVSSLFTLASGPHCCPRPHPHQGPSVGAYITYSKREEAVRAIQAVNSAFIDGRYLKWVNSNVCTSTCRYARMCVCTHLYAYVFSAF